MASICTAHGEIKSIHKIMIGKHHGKRPLVKEKYVCESNNGFQGKWLQTGFN
jgi:hypothetical protein